MPTLLAGGDKDDDVVVNAFTLHPLSVAVGFVVGFRVGVALVMAVVVYTVVTSIAGLTKAYKIGCVTQSTKIHFYRV